MVSDDQPDAREGQVGRLGVAERSAVPLKPGNAGGGKGPQFKTDATSAFGPITLNQRVFLRSVGEIAGPVINFHRYFSNNFFADFLRSRDALKVFYEEGSHTTILLGIADVTRQRVLEREKDDLLRQKDVLLEEIQHRVANSLQIITGIILLKAKTVDSEETRVHLQDAHKRVMSVAAVQQHLHASATSGSIEMGPYLSRLCETLATSMIGENRPISLKVSGEGGSATSRQAESLGLIATELVINSLKRAFSENTKDGQITVAYEVSGTDWKLSIADNGVGEPDGVFAQPKTGLGTGIVKALAQQLGAKVETLAGPEGTTVSVTHATFLAKMPRVV